MENLGKSVWEKYEIRKEAMDNMGQGQGELEEIKKEEICVLRNMEASLYNYNINLESANENIINKSLAIRSTKKIKRFIRGRMQKAFIVFSGNLLGALGFFQEKIIQIFVSNREILLEQDKSIKEIQQRLMENEIAYNHDKEIYNHDKEIYNHDKEKYIDEIAHCVENTNETQNELHRYVQEVAHYAEDVNSTQKRLDIIENNLPNFISEVRNRLDFVEKQYSKCSFDSFENRLVELELLVQSLGEEEENSNTIVDEKDDCEQIAEKMQSADGFNLQKGEYELTKAYNNRIKDSIFSNKINIVIFCMGLRNNKGIEAIRNEVYDTFVVLKKLGKYNVKLVSVERNNVAIEQDVLFVTRERVSDVMAELEPDVILLIESLPLIALDFEGAFYRYKTIVKVTSQEPLQGLNEKQIEELRHANDFGVFHFLVESNHAKKILQDRGFVNVKAMLPVINEDKMVSQTKIKNNVFTIGFASSPMSQKHVEDRGVFLLQKVMEKNPNVRFKLLWRNEEVAIPDELLEMNNCDITYGQADMKSFYKEIDALIVPYMTWENNHACSLSGIEAMLNCLPVICTDVSGISEVVLKYDGGLVCKADEIGLTKAILDIESQYGYVVEKIKHWELKEHLGSHKLEKYLEGIVDAYFPTNFITLQQWNSELEEVGKYLVKGHDKIKEYYQNQEIAQDYNYNRFIQYPGNCYDIMERASINIILGQILKDKVGKIDILDIACGDGRIVQEDIKWGACTAIDSSVEMLNIVRDRFQTENNLITRQCDFLVDELPDKYDVVTTFRYIRHYDGYQRKKIYQKVRNALRDGGILIFDVCNIEYSMEDRKKAGWKGFNIYDVFWTEETIRNEMGENGFDVAYLLPVEIKSINQGPVSWTIGAVKR